LAGTLGADKGGGGARTTSGHHAGRAAGPTMSGGGAMANGYRGRETGGAARPLDLQRGGATAILRGADRRLGAGPPRKGILEGAGRPSEKILP